ncbi:SanA/YdcF family protein [Nocardiopsis composta]|uniref:Vancomycin permeability regulator SanA n=1 Tax=Nocardiopsis composta TaxID=157465 RepID=A0A7W8QMJ6_9ACTN|nr:ElyC/SanA/YdcF family protein [Nocardiopsis composta]MBB5432543.1 vancomycin permeability regulator SanA [Nocardiopsis composta]
MRIAKQAGLALGGAALAAAAPTAWVYARAAGRRFAPEDVPERPVAIVLGAAMWPQGPSPLLARRLDLAVRLHRAGRVRAVLVSGDNRPCSGNETDGMVDYLIEAGVPERAVAADPHGYRTWDSCVRARDVYGVDAAVMVTQAFHLPRAVALARAAGIDAVGVGDASSRARSRSTTTGYLREVGASAKALRDALLRPGPAVAEEARQEARDVLHVALGLAVRG